MLKFAFLIMVLEMIKVAYENGEIRNDYPLILTTKLLTHLFTEFDRIFDVHYNENLAKILELLEKYIEFMRGGLKQ